jgi:hypothetical protein
MKNRNAVAPGLRTQVMSVVFAGVIVEISLLVQWCVMREADPTLPRYGSDFIADAFESWHTLCTVGGIFNSLGHPLKRGGT